MPISFRCPTCQRRLTAPDGSAGRRGKCQSCGTGVTVPANSFGPASPDLPAATPPTDTHQMTGNIPPNTSSEELAGAPAEGGGGAILSEKGGVLAKGIFGKMGEWAEGAHRRAAATIQSKAADAKKWAEDAQHRATATYVQGPLGVKANTPVTIIFEPGRMVMKAGLIVKSEYAITYASITGFSIDTAERMTISRILLVGIFAFGMKKKDRFLKIDFMDDTGMPLNVVLGSAIGCDVSMLQGKILQAKHNSLAGRGAAPPRRNRKGK